MKKSLAKLLNLLLGVRHDEWVGANVKLIVGLGNPGRTYENNRHNIGFRCIEQFAREHGLKFGRRQGQAYIAMGQVEGQTVVLAKPQTFMNRSGVAVSSLARFYKINPADLLIVYDDLDLPYGRLRLREKGSHGGHNGMRSIIESLGTDSIPRLRVGIGRPNEKSGSGPPRREGPDTPVVKHVLSDFSPAEERSLSEVGQRASEAILTVVREGVVAAMNKYNAP